MQEREERRERDKKIVIKAINFFDEENYFMTFCASAEFPHNFMRFKRTKLSLEKGEKRKINFHAVRGQSFIKDEVSFGEALF
jgi:hypothetical protein